MANSYVKASFVLAVIRPEAETIRHALRACDLLDEIDPPDGTK